MTRNQKDYAKASVMVLSPSDFLLKLKDKHIIKVVTGIRRCGKSTLFELYKDYLLKNGVKKEQIISLNFENPNDMKFNDWKELFVSIESRLLENKMNYIFLDLKCFISEILFLDLCIIIVMLRMMFVMS